MRARININDNILSQFAVQLGVEDSEDQIRINAQLGEGSAKLIRLPNQIELYHFKFKLDQPFELFSFNPENSEWLLININLSDAELEKTVNNKEISIQKYLPTGMLLYTPNTEVFSVSPTNTVFSIVLIRFHKSLLASYPNQKLDELIRANYAIIYEDLDYRSEQLLTKSVKADNLLLIHSHILEFLGHFFEKLRSRESQVKYEHLHPDDLKGLFTASTYLRNPFNQNLPSIEELSKIAGMGSTKFNTSFKQVFGTTPLQYNLKIKMEHAKDQLIQKLTTPSEISYQLGYSHPSKFTTAFKKQFGVLPSEL